MGHRHGLPRNAFLFPNLDLAQTTPHLHVHTNKRAISRENVPVADISIFKN